MPDRGVLVIYTGGTIGAVPSDPSDPASPLAAAPWETLRADLPELDDLDFQVSARATERPIDSSNIEPKDWLEIAEIIATAYDDFDGFVVLHGTDTMAFSASALSFMFENLTKPIVFTGAQIPVVGHPESDGRGNLLGALAAANLSIGTENGPAEVCLFFNGRLFRANRTQKKDSMGLDAFDSPNAPPIGEAAMPPAPHPTARVATVNLRREIEANVVPFVLFPGVQHTRFFRETFADPTIRGVVLHTYGVGNAPNDRAFLDVIETAARTKVIVNITQCREGAIAPGRYATSAGLAGLVANGGDMTPEAALTKLMVLLGDRDLGREAVFRLIETNLAGERT